MELLIKHNQKDFKMDTVFGIPVINILWTIVAGGRGYNIGDCFLQVIGFSPTTPKWKG